MHYRMHSHGFGGLKEKPPPKGRSSQGRDALSFAVPQLTFLTAIRKGCRNHIHGLR